MVWFRLFRWTERKEFGISLVQQIREATNGNYALGNQRFQAEIERVLGRHATRGKAGRRPKAQAEYHSKQLGVL
jgi:putative transposase